MPLYNLIAVIGLLVTLFVAKKRLKQVRFQRKAGDGHDQDLAKDDKRVHKTSHITQPIKYAIGLSVDA